MDKIKIELALFEGRARQCRKELPNRLDWPSYLSDTVKLGNKELFGRPKIIP
jgi:hypothetical protein